MASLFTNEQLPTTSEAAIRQFDERYLAGISAVQPPTWASQLGDVIDLSAPRVTFPMSLMSTKYIETREASSRYKTMQEKAFDLRVVEYDAGYEAKLMDLRTNVYSYRKWSEVPARFIIAEQRHINRGIATLLEDMAQVSPWDGLPFFSAAHKSNPTGDPAGTWSNFQPVATDVLDLSKLTQEITAMQDARDENGEKMDVNPDTIIVPTGKYQPLVVTMSQQLLVIGTGTAPSSNPYAGKFNIVHIPELTDTNDWYLVDSKLMGAQGVPPWVSAKFRAPEDLGLRYFDESSDFFKNTGKIRVTSHLWYGFALLFPHAIRRVTGV